MTTILPRPSTSGPRPAYLDNLFRDNPPPLPSPSLHSANSSISTGSTSALDFRISQPLSRPLSPAFEEDGSDGASVRSLRLNLSPRFHVRNIFNRRTYPQAKETMKSSSTPAIAPMHSQQRSRRPSLPKLQTSFTSPPRKGTVQKEKPLPAAPVQPAREIACHRCYYFAARNCNGWVMDGTHGDACEQCLQAGYFGAP